jgi:hypothetical protein
MTNVIHDMKGYRLVTETAITTLLVGVFYLLTLLTLESRSTMNSSYPGTHASERKFVRLSQNDIRSKINT